MTLSATILMRQNYSSGTSVGDEGGWGGSYQDWSIEIVVGTGGVVGGAGNHPLRDLLNQTATCLESICCLMRLICFFPT